MLSLPGFPAPWGHSYSLCSSGTVSTGSVPLVHCRGPGTGLSAKRSQWPLNEPSLTAHPLTAVPRCLWSHAPCLCPLGPRSSASSHPSPVGCWSRLCRSLVLVGPSEDSPRNDRWSLELGLHSPSVSDSEDLYASFGKKEKQIIGV